MKKFFVKKEFRSQKIGLALYNMLIEYAKEKYIEHIILDTPSVAAASHRFYRNLARKLHPTTVGCEMNCTGWLFASLFVFSSFCILTFVFVSPLAFNVFLNFFHNCRSCCCYKVAVTPERNVIT